MKKKGNQAHCDHKQPVEKGFSYSWMRSEKQNLVELDIMLNNADVWVSILGDFCETVENTSGINRYHEFISGVRQTLPPAYLRNFDRIRATYPHLLGMDLIQKFLEATDLLTAPRSPREVFVGELHEIFRSVLSQSNANEHPLENRVRLNLSYAMFQAEAKLDWHPIFEELFDWLATERILSLDQIKQFRNDHCFDLPFAKYRVDRNKLFDSLLDRVVRHNLNYCSNCRSYMNDRNKNNNPGPTSQGSQKDK